MQHCEEKLVSIVMVIVVKLRHVVSDGRPKILNIYDCRMSLKSVKCPSNSECKWVQNAAAGAK